MQYRPTAAELLDAIGALLEDELLPALPAELQHKARVAANLCRILEREEDLAAASLDDERSRYATLLGHDGPVPELASELAERLRTNQDAAFERAAWDALVAVARRDLAIAKPGHDQWEGS
jgi:hypothetical protein